jgi:methyltransferase-like protein
MAEIFKKREEIVTREIAGETILVPIRGRLADMQNIFSLNPVAYYIWRQMNGEKSVDEIGREILENYDMGKEEVDKDLQEFIKDLLKEDLIVRV